MILKHVRVFLVCLVVNTTVFYSVSFGEETSLAGPSVKKSLLITGKGVMQDLPGNRDHRGDAEIWAETRPWVYHERGADGKLLPSGDSMRDDWVVNMASSRAWGVMLPRTKVIMFFENIFSPVPIVAKGGSEIPMTDDEIAQLVTFVDDHGLEVNIEVGGIIQRKGAHGENAGEAQAAREWGLISRWVAAGGPVHYLSIDNAIANEYRRQYEDPNFEWPISMTELMDELVDYCEIMTEHIPGLKFNLYESSAAYNVTTEGGYVYASRLRTVPQEKRWDFADFLRTFLGKMRARGLDLNHYSTDHGPQAVRADGGGKNEHWDFGRIIAAEKIIRDNDIGVGILIHPGFDFREEPFDPVAVGNRSAHEYVMRYVREYITAGGNPDYFEAAVWHTHPSVTGPASGPWTAMAILRDASDLYQRLDGRRVLKYHSDEFNEEGVLWSLAGEWAVSNGRLQQSEVTQNHIAVLSGESFGDVRFEVNVQFIDKPLGWAGIQIRKSHMGDKPWESGYTVYLRSNGELVLFKAGQGTVSVYPTGLDPFTKGLDLEIEAIGSRMRVFVNSVRAFDFEDSTFTNGFTALVTSKQAASFDDFVAERIVRYTNAVNEPVDANIIPSDWIEDSGVWNAVESKFVQTKLDQGFSSLSLPDTFGNHSFSADIQITSGFGWAGLSLRKSNSSDVPWVSGYTVFLKPDGVLTLYSEGTVIATTGTGFKMAEGANLEIRALNHRIAVMVNGRQYFDWWDEEFEEGTSSLVTFQTQATFDNIRVDSLTQSK